MKYTADELKPKRYPDEKPSKNGQYWCHHHTLDYWKQLTWIADVWTYFNEYEQASVFCLWVDWFIPYRLDEPDELEREMKQSDKRTVEYTIELYSHWLDLQGYDVVKREPEIKACPNPECREKCNMDDEGYEEENEYYLRCEICGYCSPIAYNPEEAIHLHNLIAEKAE